MVYFVNQKRKKNKGKRKNSETHDKSDYYILCVDISVIRP